MRVLEKRRAHSTEEEITKTLKHIRGALPSLFYRDSVSLGTVLNMPRILLPLILSFRYIHLNVGYF